MSHCRYIICMFTKCFVNFVSEGPGNEFRFLLRDKSVCFGFASLDRFKECVTHCNQSEQTYWGFFNLSRIAMVFPRIDRKRICRD